MKTVLNIVLYFGILLVIVGISMFLYAMHMFTARGEFSALERHLAEISMVLWIPTIFGGLTIMAIAFIAKGIRRGRISLQKH